MGADGLVHHGERVGGEGVVGGCCGQQHPVAGPQAAAAAQRGGNRDVGAGGQGDHAAWVAAGGDHARVGGQGQPVTAGPAQRAGDGPVGDPAGGVDAADPVDHILGRRRHGLGVGQGQRPARGGPGPLPGLRDAGRRDEGSERLRGHGRLPAGRRAGPGAGMRATSGSAAGVLKPAAGPGEVVCAWRIPRQFACPSHHSDTPEQRVQAMSDLGRFHRFVCPRGDLNPHALLGH